MPRCAFLTMSQTDGYLIDDPLAYDPLRALGWSVSAVPWDDPDARWEDYDLVVIRSPWDYTRDPDRFLAVLEGIERRGVRLENRLPVVRWNLDKSYLRDLAARGVATVPTVWRKRLGAGELDGLLAEVAAHSSEPSGCGDVVVKPVVGASAEGAFRVNGGTRGQRAAEVEAYYADRAFQAQPLARYVIEEGEYSLFYFNGEHSHTILKTPKPEDFRVQEEHGGSIRAVTGDEALDRAGRTVLEALDEVPLYVRADFVRSNDSADFWLMELELIEPSLYLRADPDAAARFARAIDARASESLGEPGAAR